MKDSDHGVRRTAGRGTLTLVAASGAFVLFTTASAGAAHSAAPSPSATPSAVTLKPAVQTTKTLGDTRIKDPTGLVASILHPGVLWVLSDNQIFAVDTAGKTIGAYTFDNPKPLVPRALAVVKNEQGKSSLLVGDIGDSRSKRKNGVWIMSIEEPATLGNGKLAMTRQRVVYPDSPHDAGTLLVDPFDQRLYVVTVSSTGGDVYAVPSVLATGVANKMTKVRPVNFVSQDGTFMPDGRVLFRGRYKVHVLNGIKGRRIALLDLPQEAADGPVAVVDGGKTLMIVGKGGTPQMWKVAMPDLPGGGATAPDHGSGANTMLPTTKIDEPSPLPGGVLGTVSLGALTLIGLLGGVLYLRRRGSVRDLDGNRAR